MEAQLADCAWRTTSWGSTRGSRGGPVVLGDSAMSAFWQNLQARLHPRVPMEKLREPGR
jgi:hypothetical protein